jgi:hypothetical protein
MTGPVAKVNKVVFLEHLSTSYICEIWFPNREKSELCTAVCVVLCLHDTHFFILGKDVKLVHRGQPYCVCVCDYTRGNVYIYVYTHTYIYMYIYMEDR